MAMRMGGGPRRLMAGYQQERPPGKIQRSTLLRVLRLFRPYRWKVTGVLLILVVVAGLGIVNPVMLKLIIDDAILKRNVHLLLIFVGVMVIPPVVSTGLGVWQTYLHAVVGPRMM